MNDTPSMPTAARALTDRFRRTEYTGENRCLPCTVLNGCLALVLSGCVVVVSQAVVADWVAAFCGAFVLSGSAAAIYFRGYLVSYGLDQSP